MASVENLSEEKELSRRTWLYVPSSSIFYLHGFEEFSISSEDKTSAPVASLSEGTSAVAGKERCDPLHFSIESKDEDIDILLQRGNIPALFATNQLLRSQRPTLFTGPIDTVEFEQSFQQKNLNSTTNSRASNEPTVLYVGQGEIAHCTCHQADVLVSDRATTCHLLAFYSRSCFDSSLTSCDDAVSLCTMMHLDACTYDSCIRNAVQVHTAYHSRQRSSFTSAEKVNINLDVHLVGGFNDIDGTSRTITTWIMNRLIEIAEEYHLTMPELKMTLCTACVTAANHDPVNNGPVVRGLGLVCRTGQIMVAHCVHPGPAMTLRMARLWVRCHHPDGCDTLSSQPHLAVIHSPQSEFVTVAPLFPFGCRCKCGFLQNDAQQEFEYLLQIRDDKMFLKYCSTSPEHEEEDFCNSTRASFQYIRRHLKPTNLATSTTPAAPRHYRRAHRSSNAWRLQVDDPS